MGKNKKEKMKDGMQITQFLPSLEEILTYELDNFAFEEIESRYNIHINRQKIRWIVNFSKKELITSAVAAYCMDLINKTNIN